MQVIFPLYEDISNNTTESKNPIKMMLLEISYSSGSQGYNNRNGKTTMILNDTIHSNVIYICI
jgi:hypothetical protein